MKEQLKKIASLLLQASKDSIIRLLESLKSLWAKIRAPRAAGQELRYSMLARLRDGAVAAASRAIGAANAALKKTFSGTRFVAIKGNHTMTFISELAINIILKTLKITWAVLRWILIHVIDLFRKIPSDLTYWQDGDQVTVHVDDFVEITPTMIQYRDHATKKRVKVRAEYPIKYVLKEK